MEDRAKPLIKRQLEAKIQQAEEEIESLSLEVEAALNEGASEVCNRRHEISALLVQGKLSRREKDELLKEFERLFFDPLYVKFWKSTLRLRDVRQRHRSLTLELKDLETVVDPPTAPAAQTSSLPAAATSEMPRLAANSKSLFLCIWLTYQSIFDTVYVLYCR